MEAGMTTPFAGLRQRIASWASPGGNGSKALTEMQHSGQPVSFFHALMPATNIDFKKEVGNGLGSSVLAAPLNWLMRTFPEAPPLVEQLREKEWGEVVAHDLTRLLRRPNPFYGGRILWMATILEFAFGEAFWLKIRNASGKVVQIWWVPCDTMEPKWPKDGKTFISHYEYKPRGSGSSAEDIDVRDVVHFRFGIDPDNTRRGLSPLGALWREIATDDQAANFTAAILRNLGIIGVVISPKEKSGGARKEDVEAVKKYLKEHFTGDKRGEPLALGSPTDVNLMQYNLQGFDVSPIRDVSEERVCAALGIPAAVVGFGTGLHQTKVGATMKEMRQLAWTGGVIPMQEIIADECDRSLVPEFEKDDDYRLRFDSSKVRALWEDVNDKHDRIRKDVLAGIITVKQAQELLGYSIDGERDVYLQPVNLIQLPDGSLGSIAPQEGANQNE
jgi:phage portal protein BeeE